MMKFCVLALSIVHVLATTPANQQTHTSCPTHEYVSGSDGYNAACVSSEVDYATAQTNACTHIIGSLRIENTDITALDLPSLVYVSGDLVVSSNSNLEGIDLPNLVTVCGDIQVSNNAISQVVLNQLQTVNDIVITNEAALEACSFDSATEVNDLTISNTGIAHDLTIFNEKVRSMGTITIADNPELESLNSYQALEAIGALIVTNNANLSSIAFPSLQSITGEGEWSLAVTNNPQLRDMENFHHLKGTLQGAMEISGNSALEGTFGWLKLTSIGANNEGNSLVFARNARLEELDLGFVGRAEGAVQIYQNPSLKVIAGLSKISSIGANLDQESVVVQFNDVLERFIGIASVESHATGSLHIVGNPSLTDINNLGTMSNFGADANGVSILIRDNDGLVDLNAAASIAAHVSGAVLIENNGVHQVLGDPANVIVGTGNYNDGAQYDDGRPSGYLCGGVTVSSSENPLWHDTKDLEAEDDTTWQMYGTDGMYIDVDTSACGFESVPPYVASIAGDGAHWQLLGTNSIYNPTATGFRLYVWHPVMKGIFMKYFAARYNWQVTWMADTGKRSGITTVGWEPVLTEAGGITNVLKMDVNMEQSDLSCSNGTAIVDHSCKPTVIASLHGLKDHWKLHGVHSIYEATTSHFRVYVVNAGDELMDKAHAEDVDRNWQVAYIASTDNEYSGKSDASKWKPYGAGYDLSDIEGGNAIFTDVSFNQITQAGQLPALVTAVSGLGEHWDIFGGGAIFDLSSDSFRMYLDNAGTVERAFQNKWQVNYIAYGDAVECEIGEWTGWTACSVSCGTGSRSRTRMVISPAYGLGTCNHEFGETSECETQDCPADCEMSEWSEYGSCKNAENTVVDCGEDAWATRERQVEQEPAEGGLACPSLSNTTWRTQGGVRIETMSRYCGCVEDEDQSVPAECAVGEWNEWTMCSLSCTAEDGKIGKRSRTRANIILSSVNESTCEDYLHEEVDCNDVPCPVDCVLNVTWNDWGSCNETCGWGVRTRTRDVVTEALNGGHECFGEDHEERFQQEACHDEYCDSECITGTWGAWSDCTVSCGSEGPGTRDRRRPVLRYGEVDGAPVECPDLVQQESCAENIPCPVDCEMSEWSEFGECSLECGNGTWTRTRSVVQGPEEGGVLCPTETSQDGVCNTDPCPQDCTTEEWQSWSACSVSCGSGYEVRHRAIALPQSYGGNPCPELNQTQQCYTVECPTHCEVSDWEAWSECTATCDDDGDGRGGTKSRSRSVVTPATDGGMDCPTVMSQTEYCNNVPCARDCELTEWSDFTNCTKQCIPGRGSHFIKGAVPLSPYDLSSGGASPAGSLDECSDRCTSFSDCNFMSYDGVTCTLYAGEFYDITLDPLEGAMLEVPESDLVTDATSATDRYTFVRGVDSSAISTAGVTTVPSVELNDDPVTDLPVAARVCSATCDSTPSCTHVTIKNVGNDYDCWLKSGEPVYEQPGAGAPGPQKVWTSMPTVVPLAGKRYRTKSVLVQPLDVEGQDTVEQCGAMHEEESCGLEPCPQDCVLTEWSDWGTCDKTCCADGEQCGSRTRNRYVLHEAKHGGAECDTDLTDVGTCDNDGYPCPIHCETSDYTEWFSANFTTEDEMRAYQAENSLPDDHWSLHCDHECGGGRQRATRNIETSPDHGGFACPELEKVQSCNTDECPIDCVYTEWSQWGMCSKSCRDAPDEEMGTQVRKRSITVVPQHGGEECPQTQDTQECAYQLCPQDCVVGEWGEYGDCSQTCGWGTKTRSRDLTAPLRGGVACPQSEESDECHDIFCPIDCSVSEEYSEWSSCSQSCGDTGVRSRTLSIIQHPLHDGTECPSEEDRTEEVPCERDTPCPEDCVVEEWGAWAPYAGGGNKVKRTREAQQPTNGGKACPALEQIRDELEGREYCGQTYYGPWTECSKDCGSGHKYRWMYHYVCSQTAVLAYNQRVRMGALCNTHDCTLDSKWDQVETDVGSELNMASLTLSPCAFPWNHDKWCDSSKTKKCIDSNDGLGFRCITAP